MNILDNIGKCKKGLFIVLLFLIVFNPPLIKSISFTTIMTVIGGIYLILHIQELCIFLNRIKSSLVVFFIFLIYYFFISLCNSFSNIINTSLIWNSFFSSVFTTICSIVIALFIVILSEKLLFSKVGLFDSYVKVGLIQGIISLLCVFSKEIKTTLNNLMINNSSSDKIANSVKNTSEFRNFGFASTLYDIFGFTMSIIAIVSFYLGIKNKSKKYFVFSIIIAIAASLNARTSVALIAVGYCILLIKSRKRNDGNSFIRNVFFSILFILLIVIFFSILLNSNSHRGEWFRTGIYEIQSFFKGENEGYFYTLFNDFIFFPEGILSVVFGTSLTPMELSIKNTDVGYIQNIWKYGIVGSVLIYMFWLMLIIKSIGNCLGERIDKRLFLAIGIMIFIYQIKLNCWGYSMAGCVFIPVLFKSMGTEDCLIFEMINE